MSDLTHTFRQPLGPVRGNQAPAQSLPAFALVDAPAGQAAQHTVNTTSILSHAGTYGEPVDPGLAQLVDQNNHFSTPTVTAQTLSKRVSATAARSTIETAMHSDDDEASALAEVTAAVRKRTGASESSVQRKARLMQVAESCSLDSPPSDADLGLMQGKPLKIVLQKLRIKGNSCSISAVKPCLQFLDINL